MRKYLVAVAALSAVVALGLTATAFGASPNTSAETAKFNPDNPGGTVTKGGMFVETSTLLTGDPGTPTTPTVEPVPTTNVVLHFDKTIKFNLNAVPSCGDALSGSTQDGMKACSASYVGGGYATICGATGGPGTTCDLGVLNAQIAAYKGVDSSQLLIQGRSDHTPVGPFTTVLTGTLSYSPLGGQFDGGKRIVVPVSLLFAGGAAITDLAVTVNNASIVKASCSGDMDWDYKANFTYADSSTSSDASSQPCT